MYLLLLSDTKICEKSLEMYFNPLHQSPISYIYIVNRNAILVTWNNCIFYLQAFKTIKV